MTYTVKSFIRRSISEKIEEQQCLTKLRMKHSGVTSVKMESKFYVEHEISSSPIDDGLLRRILVDHWDVDYFQKETKLQENMEQVVIEIGPRISFKTAFSTNCVSICKSAGLGDVTRIERARRYQISLDSTENSQEIISILYDKMTEQIYEKPLTTFASPKSGSHWKEIDIMGAGMESLHQANLEMSLGFDEEEMKSYYDLFMKMGRNPTSVELFDLAQSNSEHSRHWFFKGKYIVEGLELEKSLMEMVSETNRPTNINTNENNIIKFNDNSSAIKGSSVTCMRRDDPTHSSQYGAKILDQDIILTAETHNFPTGVAPFSGATTGTGGRIRDIQATGRGGRVIAGTAGYCFGDLNIPGFQQPWENPDKIYPGTFATPLEIAIEASNGASDYGNKFGEPVITGFARSFGMMIESDDGKIKERREWIKPIMFSAGIGAIDGQLVNKNEAKEGDLIVKVGGPAYRIGVGGGAASSTEVQGDSSSERDLQAVQRGDPEMEQKMNRILLGCMELDDGCPIRSIHDQGAGGNANVLKELVEEVGGVVFTESFSKGDETLSVLELWGAEYQESNAMLVEPDLMEKLMLLSEREKCQVDKVGFVAKTGKVQLVESPYDERVNTDSLTKLPVDLNLKSVFSGMPRKVFNWTRRNFVVPPAKLPLDLTLMDVLHRILRLPAVGSKRYLTNKVDRSVSGLIAQQQCCGPSHMPLADVAVVALSHMTTKGAATSIGEQPIKILVNPEAGARMTVIEALTNLCSAKITDIKDIKCSANWMWPAKLPGEGYELYSACDAMCKIMHILGIGIDGGKDSLSMAARVPLNKDNSGNGNVVKAPGALVVSAYAPCENIKHVVTPDLKVVDGGESRTMLLLVRPTIGKSRIGGTALTQVYSVLGHEAPDVNERETETFILLFKALQHLIGVGKVLAMHDISDGGLLTCIFEMAMAGQIGVRVDLPSIVQEPVDQAPPEVLAAFNEEPGWVLQINESDYDFIKKYFEDADIVANMTSIGEVKNASVNGHVEVYYNGVQKLRIQLKNVIEVFEETSFEIEKLQMNPECAETEYKSLKEDLRSSYRANFEWREIEVSGPTTNPSAHTVAIVREEGTNGDKEMASAFLQSGFAVFDVTMTDILKRKVKLSSFKGLVFPGGFSYADVLGSAAGWALAIKEQKDVLDEFTHWSKANSTFSLGICNGCQLMARLGWIGEPEEIHEPIVSLLPNLSGRFESRWSRLKIRKSSSIFFKDMEDSILGCWVAHGEGRFEYKSETVERKIFEENLVTIEYVDKHGNSTTSYPENPNGSKYGVAAITSSNGRHLAMMPHPERAFVSWQWPDQRNMLSWEQEASPWARMFQNAYDWCSEMSSL